MKIKNMLVTSVLFVLTLFVWMPIWMLLTGSLMGEDEAFQNIGPILDQAKGNSRLVIVSPVSHTAPLC